MKFILDLLLPVLIKLVISDLYLLASHQNHQLCIFETFKTAHNV